MSAMSSSFERAARNLAGRYCRRFPAGRGWDATSIKDRWYRRRTCQFVRVRLDHAPMTSAVA